MVLFADEVKPRQTIDGGSTPRGEVARRHSRVGKNANKWTQSLAAQQNQVQHVFNSFKHTQALLKSKWLEKCNICEHQGKILQLTVKSFGYLKPGSALLPIRVGPATALQLLQLKHQQHLRAEQTPSPINLVPYIILIYQQTSTAPEQNPRHCGFGGTSADEQEPAQILSALCAGCDSPAISRQYNSLQRLP